MTAIRTTLLRVAACCLILLCSALPAAAAGTADVMLQGFNWESHDCNWYNTLRDKASDIASLGINLVWFPQPASSSGGMGYLIQKYYDLNNAVGSQTQLKEAIGAMHGAGVKVLADIVINHRVGVHNWADFEQPSWGSWSVCSDDEWGQGTGNADSGDKYAAARDLDHSNTTVQNDITAWLNWLKDANNAGFDGWRYDYSKGYWGGYTKIYNEGSSPLFSVGEFWPDIPGAKYYDSYPNTDWHRQILVDWINAAGSTSTAFDFTTKWQLQLAMERGELWRLGSVPGLIGWWGEKAVTFLDNHDTGSTQNHWPFPGNKVLQGYAYILTHPGIPCIFWDHLYTWGHYNAIKAMLAARKAAGVLSDSPVSVQKSEANLYAALVGSNLAMKIGSGSWSPTGSDWTMAASGTDYAIWTKGGNPVPVTFSPAVAVAGQSLTVTYQGILKDAASLNLHWGHDGFQIPQVTAMTKQGNGSWTATVTVPAAATAKFDCYFKDGANNTDNNSGANYHADVTSNSTVEVNIHYAATWTSANIHYKNNGTWTATPGEAMTGYRTGWFKKTIQRLGASLEFVFNNGTTWDNNNSLNYTSTLTNLWVKNGVITATDPGEELPAFSCSPASPVAGSSVTVTYNGTLKNAAAVTMHWGYDGWKGVTDSPMTKQGNGSWQVTVAVPAAATTTFDAVFKDGANNWDNNGGSDWHVTISTGGDTEAPTVALTAPVAGTTVSGEITLAATAADNVGVTKVEFFLRGVKVGEDTTAPYSITVNTAALSNGAALVRATAYDAAGNNASSDRNVTIDNGQGTVTKKIHYFRNDPARNAFIQYRQGSDDWSGYPGEKMSGSGWVYWEKILPATALGVRFNFSGGRRDYNDGSFYTFTANEVWIKNGTVYTSDPETDNINPVVSISAPLSGSSVSNTVTITAPATDNEGVVKVEFWINGELKATDTTAPYSYSWDTTTVPNGSVTVMAKAFDAAGNNAAASIAVTVNNYTGPDNAPVVDTLTIPAGNVSGNATVSATASDDKGISKVAFYIGTTLLGEDTSAPYSITFNTAAHANGSHTIKAVAYDTANQTGEKTGTITILNQGDPYKPYTTNPTLGKYVSGGITIDGQAGGQWTDDMLIAVGMANDDPRSLGGNWSMHETPWDMTHLWACWDDNNLYLAWQYVDVTDMIDPANAGSSAGTKPFQMNLIQWIAIDTVQGAGSGKDMWGKNGGEDYWTGSDLPDWQIYVASNLWQGYISKAVNGSFVVNGTDPALYQKFVQNPAQGSTVGTPVGTTGINIAWGNALIASKLWGVNDCDHALANPIDPAKVVDFKTMGHDGGRDTFYEIKIPFAYLGITRAQLESQGIGIMLGQGEYSSLNTLPFDQGTVDTPGVTASNSPKEWEDIDHFTVPFARIGHQK